MGWWEWCVAYIATTSLLRRDNERTTLNTIDVAEHASKRKLLSLVFTERMVRAASAFIIKYVDRWNELLLDEVPDGEWPSTIDFSERIDALAFDIMGDLSFGRSFDIKGRGENPLKVIPHAIAEYMKFYYPMCRSPLLGLLLWLEPCGLDALFELITPPAVQKYNDFIYKSVTDRIALFKKQEQEKSEHREDIMYFLCDAKNPDTGLPAYNEDDIRAESSLLVIAGSDTTAISLSGIFFYLTGDPERCQKLVDEILSTFSTVEDIVYGPKLQSCVYLKACIDEGMRLTPSGPCELLREILPGGLNIMGEHYPAGVVVGTVPWVNSRNDDIYGDANVFRPERWIADEAAGITKESISRIKNNFHPFTSGLGACLGRNLAYTEMMLVVARTLHRAEVRRAPGSTFGGGSTEQDKGQMQLQDAYVSLRQGPEVQFRKRVSR